MPVHDFLRKYGPDQVITIKPEHIWILKKMNIRWNDEMYEGAPCVDLKRPYGNSNGVVSDITKILRENGYKIDKNEIDDYAMSLHNSMRAVLAILCQHPEGISAGQTYARYLRDWEIKQ